MLELAADAIKIEDHYSNNAGHPMPMDIEWAKDARRRKALHYSGAARDRRVAARSDHGVRDLYARATPGTVLAVGRAVGEKIASRAGAGHRRRAPTG